MLSIFKRLKSLTLSNINALIDKAEDPVKMTDQYLRDMAEDIRDIEGAVAKQIAIANRFEQQLKEAEQMVQRRDEQALQAMEQGKEDLARRALQDKREHQSKVDALKPQYETARATADKLKAQLQEMKDQYNSLRSKRDMLVARAEAAKAQKSINDSMSSFNVDGTKAGIDRMMDKVARMEAEAQAGLELRGDTKDLDAELAELNKDSGIDDELEALRARVAAKKSGQPQA